jgi:AcrR family transcriptional regulator
MGRRKKGEDDASIKLKLIDKIGEFFLMRGFASFTMDAISRAFKVSKKTLYRFFPTKEDMILQVASLLTRRIRAIAERRLKAIETGGPTAFVPQMAQLMEKLGSLMLMMPASMMSDLESETPLVAEKIDGLRRAIVMDVFTRILEVGKRMGQVRPDIDSELAAYIYSAMLTTITSRRGISPMHSPYQVFIAAVKILFEGILAPEARKAFDSVPSFSPGSENPWRYLKEEAEGD